MLFICTSNSPQNHQPNPSTALPPLSTTHLQVKHSVHQTLSRFFTQLKHSPNSLSDVNPHEPDQNQSEYVGDMDDIMKSWAKELPKQYSAFVEYEGIDVAWNQVKLYDFLQRPEDLERLFGEIHLLKTLKHGRGIKGQILEGLVYLHIGGQIAS
ncbi:hypothetical protein M8C21_024800 [Ambrosia artemisiifolia]|uniref:non-specific serine/threonine protein kinase n=1 Tax=Ambrosia artemisiifolia TaxID=4212 RepID=A0AAD5GV36_AMBAR|nr:hypothetical protein M8C21_024800 [Ambrosia artemisiifolia]